MNRTFPEFVKGYADHYGSDGETWLQEYVLGLLEAGVTTVQLVDAVVVSLTEQMVLEKGRGAFSEFGYLWSKRSRLEYMLIDWKRYLETGENYF